MEIVLATLARVVIFIAIMFLLIDLIKYVSKRIQRYIILKGTLELFGEQVLASYDKTVLDRLSWALFLDYYTISHLPKKKRPKNLLLSDVGIWCRECQELSDESRKCILQLGSFSEQFGFGLAPVEVNIQNILLALHESALSFKRKE